MTVPADIVRRSFLARVGRGCVPPSGRIGYGAALRVQGRPAHRSAPPDPELVTAVLRRAVALGAVLIDTADSYGPTLSEALVAGALHPYPSHLVVATKGGVVRQGPNTTRLNGRPAHLRAACEASLRRLRVDAIGLYQLHWPDPAVPFADQVGALADLRAAGKIIEVGLCNITVEQLVAASRIVPVAAVQGRFSPDIPEGGELVATCAKLGIAFLAHGSLSGLRGHAAPPVDITTRHPRATPAQTALARVLRRAPHSIVIPGTLDPAHLEENMAAPFIATAGLDLPRRSGPSDP